MKIRNLLKRLVSFPLPLKAGDDEPGKNIFDSVLFILVIAFFIIAAYILFINTNLLKEPLFSTVTTPGEMETEELDLIIDDHFPGNPSSIPGVIILAGNSAEKKMFWQLKIGDNEYHPLENKDSRFDNIINYHDKIIKAAYLDQGKFLFCTKSGAIITVQRELGITDIQNQPLLLKDDNSIKITVQIKETREQAESPYRLLFDNDDNFPFIYSSISNNIAPLSFFNVNIEQDSQRDFIQVRDENNKQHTFIWETFTVFHLQLNGNELSIKELELSSDYTQFRYFSANNKYLFFQNNLFILDTIYKDRVLMGAFTDAFSGNSYGLQEKRFSIDTGYEDILYEIVKNNTHFLITGTKDDKQFGQCFSYNQTSHAWKEIEVQQNEADSSIKLVKQVIPFKQGFIFVLADEKNYTTNLYYLDINSENLTRILGNDQETRLQVLTDRNDILVYELKDNSITYMTISMEKDFPAAESTPLLKTIFFQTPADFMAHDLKILKQDQDILFFCDQQPDYCQLYKMHTYTMMMEQIANIQGTLIDYLLDGNNLIVYIKSEQLNYAIFFNTDPPFIVDQLKAIPYIKKIHIDDKIIFLNNDHILATAYDGSRIFESREIYELQENQYLFTMDNNNYIINFQNKYLKQQLTSSNIVAVTDNYAFSRDNQKINILQKNSLLPINTSLYSSNLAERSLQAKLIFKENQTNKNQLIFENTAGQPNILYLDQNVLNISAFKKQPAIDNDSITKPEVSYLLQENDESRIIIEKNDKIRFYKINNKNIINIQDTELYSYQSLPQFKIDDFIFWGDFTRQFYYKNTNKKQGNIVKKDCLANLLQTGFNLENRFKLIFDPVLHNVYTFYNQNFGQYQLSPEDIFYIPITISGNFYFLHITAHNVSLYRYVGNYKEYIGNLDKALREAGGIHLYFLDDQRKPSLNIKSNNTEWTSFSLNQQPPPPGDTAEIELIIKEYMSNIKYKYKRWKTTIRYNSQNINMEVLIKDQSVEQFFFDRKGFIKEELKDSYYSNIDLPDLNTQTKVFHLDDDLYIAQAQNYNLIEKRVKLYFMQEINSALVDNQFYSDYEYEIIDSVYYNSLFNIFYLNNTIFHNSGYNDNMDHFQISEQNDFSIKNICSLIFDYRYDNNNSFSSLHELPVLFNADNYFIFNDGIYFNNQTDYLFFTANRDVKRVNQSDYNQAYNNSLQNNTRRKTLFTIIIKNIKDNPIIFSFDNTHLNYIRKHKDFFTNKDYPQISFIDKNINLTKDKNISISINTTDNQLKDYNPYALKGTVQSIPIRTHTPASDFAVRYNVLYHKRDQYNDIYLMNHRVILSSKSHTFVLKDKEYDQKNLASKELKRTEAAPPPLFLKYEADGTPVHIFSYEQSNTINQRINSFEGTPLEFIEQNKIPSLMEKELYKHKNGLFFDELDHDKIKEQVNWEKDAFFDEYGDNTKKYYFKEYNNNYYYFSEDGLMLTTKKLYSPYYNAFLYLFSFPNLFYLFITGFILFNIFSYFLFRIIILKKKKQRKKER